MLDTPVSLLERLRVRPDPASWQQLVDLYAPWIHRWLRRHKAPVQDEEDIIQEILSVVVKKLPDFEHNRQAGAFRSWLRAITVNRLREYWNSSQAGLVAPATGDSDFLKMLEQLEDPSSNLSRLWDQEHDQHVTRRLLEMIKPDFEPTTWQAFRHVVLDGVKPADVAKELGIPTNAVYIAKSKVLGRLREVGKNLVYLHGTPKVGSAKLATWKMP